MDRDLVCAHVHSIVHTQKILTFMLYTGECRQQKHTQLAPSTKTDCDYLSGWITKTVTYAKFSPKMVNPRDIAGERRRRRRSKSLLSLNLKKTRDRSHAHCSRGRILVSTPPRRLFLGTYSSSCVRHRYVHLRHSEFLCGT